MGTFGLQPVEKVAKVMERPFYMNPKKAVDFGVADKVVERSILIGRHILWKDTHLLLCPIICSLSFFNSHVLPMVLQILWRGQELWLKR